MPEKFGQKKFVFNFWPPDVKTFILATEPPGPQKGYRRVSEGVSEGILFGFLEGF